MLSTKHLFIIAGLTTQYILTAQISTVDSTLNNANKGPKKVRNINEIVNSISNTNANPTLKGRKGQGGLSDIEYLANSTPKKQAKSFKDSNQAVLKTKASIIYPNPSSNYITIQLAGAISQDMEIKIYSHTGKIVASTTLRAGSYLAIIDISALLAGVYIAKLPNTEIKVIKQ